MSLLDLFKKTAINMGCVTIQRDSAGMLEHEFDIAPKAFLNFAKQDYKARDERGNINALTNAKRAIDCQTDKILLCFGFPIDRKFPTAANAYIRTLDPDLDKTDLPYKLKLLQALDLAPANIIANTRTVRNKLEHYYERFTDGDVENAIQLADLFINATDSKLKMVWSYRIEDELQSELAESGMIDVNFEVKTARLKVSGFHERVYTDLIYSSKDIEFYALLKLTYSFHYQQDIEDYFKELLRIIEHPVPLKSVRLTII